MPSGGSMTAPPGRDDAPGEGAPPLADGADHTEPRVGDTRIDADDDHGLSILGATPDVLPANGHQRAAGGQAAAAAFSRISSGTSKFACTESTSSCSSSESISRSRAEASRSPTSTVVF